VCEEHTLGARMREVDGYELAQAERLAKRLGGAGACEHCVRAEIKASMGPFVVVFRGGDPIRAEMLLETLLDEGLDARALGTRNAALLGAGQHIFEQRIEVPQPQAARAGSLIDALSGEWAVEASDAEAAAGVESEEGDEVTSPTSQDSVRTRRMVTGVLWLLASLVIAGAVAMCL